MSTMKSSRTAAVTPSIPKLRPDREVTPLVMGEEIRVPLIIAGEVLADVDYEVLNLTLHQTKEDYLDANVIDFQPPYQRNDNVWSDERCSNLLRSLINKVPVPPIYLCPIKKNSSKLYPVDGLQRLMALLRFFRDQITVTVEVKGPDGQWKKRRLRWSQISGEKQYGDLKRLLSSRSISLMVLEHLPLEIQRLLFVAVNSGVALNDDENNYCANFLARKFFRYVYEDVFGVWAGVFSRSVVENRRFRGDRVSQELLMLTGLRLKGQKDALPAHRGIVLTDTLDDEAKRTNDNGEDFKWDAPPLRKTERRESAVAIHRKLRDTGVDYGDELDVYYNMFELGFLDTLRSVSKILAKLFQENPQLGLDKNAQDQNRQPRNVLDPLAFFFHKVQKKELTLTALKDRKEDVLKILKSYFQKKGERNYKMSTSDAHMMTNKVNLLEEIFTEKW